MAVEIIEASDVITSVKVIKATQVLEINQLTARMTLFWCLEKKSF